jgi:hypothetical protein
LRAAAATRRSACRTSGAVGSAAARNIDNRQPQASVRCGMKHAALACGTLHTAPHATTPQLQRHVSSANHPLLMTLASLVMGTAVVAGHFSSDSDLCNHCPGVAAHTAPPRQNQCAETKHGV